MYTANIWHKFKTTKEKVKKYFNLKEIFAFSPIFKISCPDTGNA